MIKNFKYTLAFLSLAVTLSACENKEPLKKQEEKQNIDPNSKKEENPQNENTENGNNGKSDENKKDENSENSNNGKSEENKKDENSENSNNGKSDENKKDENSENSNNGKSEENKKDDNTENGNNGKSDENKKDENSENSNNGKSDENKKDENSENSNNGKSDENKKDENSENSNNGKSDENKKNENSNNGKSDEHKKEEAPDNSDKYTVDPKIYSRQARAGKTWWVYNVNNDIKDSSNWRYAFGTVKALEWKKGYNWFDVNKVYPNKGGDSNLCWAASGANIIHWWLKQNKENLAKINYKGPRNITDYYHSEVFDLYKKVYQNTGNDLIAPINWFFNGKYGEHYKPGGGFFVDIFGEDFIAIRQIGVHAGNFSDEIAKAIKSKEAMTCMIAYPGERYLHAISIWGADFDSNGEITHIYLTDSNDKSIEEYNNNNESETKAGMIRKAIQFRNGVVYHASSAENEKEYQYKIYHIGKLGLHQKEWDEYFAKRK